MTFCEIYAELKGWQPVIGAVIGFGALTWGHASATLVGGALEDGRV